MWIEGFIKIYIYTLSNHTPLSSDSLILYHKWDGIVNRGLGMAAIVPPLLMSVWRSL